MKISTATIRPNIRNIILPSSVLEAKNPYIVRPRSNTRVKVIIKYVIKGPILN